METFEISEVKNSKPKFNLGEVVMSRTVHDRFMADGSFRKFVLKSVGRYSRCDWGDLEDEDKDANDYAVAYNYRVVASYAKNGIRILIITEANRSVTTVLFPEEY